jgi:hypothetical protein
MKIGIQYSGQFRGYAHCNHSFIKNHCQILKFGVLPIEDLVFSNYLLEFNEVSYQKDILLKEPVDFENAITYSKEKIIYNNYTPKGRMQSYLLQWHGVYKCSNMRKEFCLKSDIDLDFIVRCRWDINILDNIDFNNFKKGILYIPNRESFSGYFDRFAIGSKDVMDVYCDLFSNLDLIKKFTGSGNSESKLKQYLDLKQIEVKLFDVNLNRLNFNKTEQL